MANIFVKTGGDFSGLTFQKVVSATWLMANTSITVGAGNAANTARFIPFTAAEGGDCEGAMVGLNIRANSAAQSVAVSLQEALGAFTVTVANPAVFTLAGHGMSDGDTVALTTTGALPTGLNATTIYFVKNKTLNTFELSLSSGGASIATTGTQSGTHTLWHDKRRTVKTYEEVCRGTTLSTGSFYKYIEWSSVYTIDTTASKYRLGVFSTDANCLLEYLQASSTTYGYAIVITGTTTYSPSDDIYINEGITVTTDQSWTANFVIMGSESTLDWDTTPASSYTLTITEVWFPSLAKFKVGTPTNRIPYAQEAVLAVATFRNAFAWSGDGANTFHLYGETPTNVATTAATTAASGQRDIVLSNDYSASWTAGDSLAIFTSSTVLYHTVTSLSGTTLTVNSNLAANVGATYAVVNLTRAAKCGVKFSSRPSFNVGHWHSIKVSGLNTQALGFTMSTCYATSIAYLSAASIALIEPVLIDNIFSSNQGISFTANSTDITTTAARYFVNSVMSNIYIVNTNSNTKLVFSFPTTWNISNVYLGSYVTLVVLTGSVGLNFTNCHWGTTWGTSGYYLISGAYSACTFTNCNLTSLWFGINGVNNTFTNCKYSGGGGIYPQGSSIVSFVNCSFGQGTVNTYDFLPTPYFVQITTQNCLFGNGVKTADLYTQLDGSFFRADTYGQTANDHRSWWRYGAITSTGDGLTDTTVRTSGTGKFAIKFEPLSSTSNLTWDFDVPTGNIQNKTMTVGVWCKINSATYYAGTHQKPRLTINYDNGTTAYAEATGSTDWQLLHVTFTPTTTYGQITVTVSGRTDATSTDAYFYIDDFGVSYPPNVALDLGGLDNWANGLPVTPPVSLPLSAGTVAQQVALNVPGQIKYIDGGEIPIY